MEFARNRDFFAILMSKEPYYGESGIGGQIVPQIQGGGFAKWQCPVVGRNRRLKRAIRPSSLRLSGGFCGIPGGGSFGRDRASTERGSRHICFCCSTLPVTMLGRDGLERPLLAQPCQGQITLKEPRKGQLFRLVTGQDGASGIGGAEGQPDEAVSALCWDLQRLSY